VTTIRRIYAYLLAFAGLAMLSVAAANLTQLLLDVVLRAPTATSERYVRDTVSINGAAMLVGLPVWLLHWWWAQRATRSQSAETASALRRLYLYAVLAVAVLAGSYALHETLVAALEARPLASSLPPLATVTVALIVWVYHWPIVQQVAPQGGTLRRWYIYGSAFIGYLLLVNGARQTFEQSWQLAVGPGTSAGVTTAPLASGIADALVGLGVWLLHWVLLPPVAGEERATLRSVYLFLSLAVAVAGTVGGLAEALYYALARALGVDRPGGVGGSLLQAAAGPVSIIVVYGCAWLYTRSALADQAPRVALPVGQADGLAGRETVRQAGVRRFYTYLVALIGLVALAVGAAGLLWVVGDALTSAPGTAGGDWWRDRVSGFATVTVVGLLVWLLHWRPGTSVGVDELTAFSRRLYVYLALIAASLTLLGSAAFAAYRLLTILLGASAGPSFASELAHDLANALVASVVIAYHWPAVRTSSPAPGAEHYEALIRVRAPDAASVQAAIDRLREAGLQVEGRS
jgi:hypothetical protein